MIGVGGAGLRQAPQADGGGVSRNLRISLGMTITAKY